MPSTPIRAGDLTVEVVRPAEPTKRPPVLLLHGLFGGAWMWERYQVFLARHGYESHALNLRGSAGSRPVADIGPVRFSDYLTDALEMAGRLENPFVIGHSLGGLLAQKVAEAGRARALVLITPAPPRGIPVVSWLLLRKQLKYARQMLLAQPILPNRDDANAIIFNRTPREQADVDYLRLRPDSGRVALELSVGVVGVREQQVTVPVLVQSARDDCFVVPRVVRAVARKYGADLREYDHFGHMLISEPGWEGPAADVVQWLDARR